MRKFTPRNTRLIYESRQKNGNLIRKWASNTMIFMPERGSVKTKSQFLTSKKIVQRHSIQLKFKYNPYYQLRKRGTHQEPHRSVPENFFLKRKNYVTQQIRMPTWNLMRKQARSNWTLAWPTPAVQNTFYVVIWSLIAMTIIDFNSWAALMFSTERKRRRSGNCRSASRNKNVAVQTFCRIPCWLFPGD